MAILIFTIWYIYTMWEEEHLHRLAEQHQAPDIWFYAADYEREQEAKYQARQRVRGQVAEREGKDLNLINAETNTFEWNVKN